MIIKVIDSFDTMNPPTVDLPPVNTLRDDLQGIASSMVSICKLKLQTESEDISLADLKEVAKVALDIQKAFFTEKSSAVQVNNINVSNTQLNYFKGIMQNEI